MNQSLTRQFFRFTIPTILSMVAFSLYTLVDGIFVAKGVGETALAAVNLSSPYNSFMFAVGLLLAVGMSTTIAIRGQHDRVIGLLCINLYLATPILDFVTGILPQTSSVFTAEHFAENSSDAVSQKLAEAKNAVFSNASVLPSMRNKEIIRLLYNWHVFELKSAIDQVAEALNISSHTVYFHLRNLTKKRDSEEVV